MQSTEVLSQYSVSEIEAGRFANSCWECHPRQRGELANYLKTTERAGHGILLGAFDASGILQGRVAVEVHEGYATRGRQCATFGWLDGANAGVVKTLLETASAWAAKQEVVHRGRKAKNPLLRGPISLPKNLGGVGCQVEGFTMPRMSAVPTNRPELGQWIAAAAGFKADAPYACLDVTSTPVWESAPGELPGFTLATLTREEWEVRVPEIAALGAEAFGEFLPDTTSGRGPAVLAETGNWSPTLYSWPAAFDAEGKLAGLIIALPNLWEAWDGQAVTGLNVDTVIISPKYRGCGLFSAIHNKGVADTRAHNGIRYYEGTAIWMANEAAVKSIFPHGRLVRKHDVFEKRLKHPK